MRSVFHRPGDAPWRRRIVFAALAVAAARAEPPPPTPEFDLRLRQVRLDREGAGAISETRLRLEARLEAPISDAVTAVVALATCRQGAPVAAEATLGEDPGDLPLAVRTASLAWRPETVPGLTLLAGKMEAPWARASDLVWDDDVRPEGGAVRWSRARGALDALALAGAFILRDDDFGGEREYLYAVQMAARHRWPDRSFALAGAGFYPSDTPASDSGRPSARALRCRPLEIFAAGTWELYFPVRGVIHYVVNPEAERARAGGLAGLTIGRTDAIHGLELGWQWRRIESDAVQPAFTDDTLWPGTGRTEHRWRVAYRPAARLLLSLVWSEGRRLDGAAPDGLRAVSLEARAEF